MNQRAERQTSPRRGEAAARRVQSAPAPLPPYDEALETEPVHHRWLLTTCVAGIAGSLVIGSAVLGVFGENAAPRNAYAAVDKASLTGSLGTDGQPASGISAEGASIVSSAYHPQADMVVPERDLSGDNNYPSITSDELPYGDGKTVVLNAEIASAEQETENITTITKTAPPEPVDETFKLDKGQTLADALVDKGITRDVAQSLVASIEAVFPMRLLKAGTEFDVTLDRQQDFYGRDATYPVELSFNSGPTETIIVQSDEDGNFNAAIDGAKPGTKSQYAEVKQFHTVAKVGSSIYATAKDNKIPDYITAELMRVFSFDVDFQHQVKPSDSFEVFYGAPLTGSSSKRKVLHYARLTLDGVSRTYYRYTTADGLTDYFDEAGNSATKSLLKTPVAGAKLTSGFGMRVHPLLGYTKMHTGVDFGVPYGTPIRAAGSGTVKIAGRFSAYGITVEIQHNQRYETLYAHMSKLAAGIIPGTRVNQGQVIGYVGATGRATGPHLHYEVRVNDRPVNPTRITMAGGRQLGGKDLAKFRQSKLTLAGLMKNAPSAGQLAQATP